MRLFRNESGFALPLALLVMVTTSAILVTAITTSAGTVSAAPIRPRRRRKPAPPGDANPEMSLAPSK